MAPLCLGNVHLMITVVQNNMFIHNVITIQPFITTLNNMSLTNFDITNYMKQR